MTFVEDEWQEPLRGTLRTVLGTLVLLAILGAILAVLMVVAKSERTETAIVDPGEVGQVRIEADIANVIVRPARGDELEFQARIVDGLSKTFYVLGKRGDTYVLDADCRPLIAPGCGVTVTIGIPEGLPVVVETTTGDVKLQNLAGVASVMTVDGDVRGTKLRLVDLSTQTEAGDVSLDFAADPYGVKLRSSAGDIRAAVPHTAAMYAVNAKSKSGDVSSLVANTPGSDRFITVDSKSGDVLLSWAN